MFLNQIKKLWIEFFKNNNYLEIKERSMVPKNDNSILWVNSGVSAIKEYFANPENSPAENIVNSQRVIRTNDIERIDQYSYHQTLFEMLGCFSIGGNFKDSVIPLIWSFLTEEKYLNINPSNLFVTVLEKDHETFSIWKKQQGLSSEKIIFCTEETNFWDMGEGPCGPNTEIYYCFDLKKNKSEKIDLDDKNFIEIANLVFSDRYHEKNSYLPLEKKCVDVGIGLERISLVTQGVSNTFEIDIWKNPLAFLKENVDLNNDEWKWKFNVIVDHLRTFIIAVFDGVLPDSKHRGYIIKKLLKKVFWNSYYLNFSVKSLIILSSIIIDSNYHFEGIINKKQQIIKIVRDELTKISENLVNYQNEIKNYIEKNISTSEISAKKVFFWYDTKGIPIEFISFYLQKKGFFFSEVEFNELLNKQRVLGVADKKNKKIPIF